MRIGTHGNEEAAGQPTRTLTDVYLSFQGGGLNSEGELLVGRTVQFNAFARYSDGSGETVTPRMSAWTTANAAIATVSADGLVLGVGPGITAIRATYQDINSTLNIIVVR